MPRLLPWIGLLLLLLLKRNRSAQAWRVAGLTLVANLGLDLVNAAIAETEIDFFLQIARAGVFGLAAVWLLSPYFHRQIRFLAFLGNLLAVEVSGVLAAAAGQEWSNDDERLRLLAGSRETTFTPMFGRQASEFSRMSNFDLRI